MSEIVEKKKVLTKEAKFTNRVFLVSFVAITILLLGFTIFLAAEPFRVSNVEEIKHLNYDNYTSKSGEYYVFIYTDSTTRSEWYDEIVVEYANYARRHLGATPIYVYNYDAKGNSKIATDLSITSSVSTSLPGLILIKDGSVSTKYLTWTKLNNELSGKMEK